MKISLSRPAEGVVLATLQGRLDAKGAQDAEESLLTLAEARLAIVDMSGVAYLSSAGVRIFLALHKRMQPTEGRVVLAALQPYCEEVLRISGLQNVLETAASLDEAFGGAPPPPGPPKNDIGTFVYNTISQDPAYVEVLGHVRDVLSAQITEAKVYPKHFSAKEHSIGLGALGPSMAEVMPVLGEMMTIGGTMVWLPTDGNDTPDFLVPQADSDQVLIHTGFNVSLNGHFQEAFEFSALPSAPATLSQLYREIFDRARKTRPDYRGAVWLSLRAEMAAVFGSGITRSPIASHAPANGREITDASNFFDWFEYDETPRLPGVTGLICGLGIDLDGDLSRFDQKFLGAAFYINPANRTSSREMLHNHGVFFSRQPQGPQPRTLEGEIAAVVRDGDFIDMRHLLDRTAITSAFGGIAYIHEFRADPALR